MFTSFIDLYNAITLHFLEKIRFRTLFTIKKLKNLTIFSFWHVILLPITVWFKCNEKSTVWGHFDNCNWIRDIFYNSCFSDCLYVTVRLIYEHRKSIKLQFWRYISRKIYFPTAQKYFLKIKLLSNQYLKFLQVNINQYHALVLLPFTCVWSQRYFQDRTEGFWTTVILNPFPLNN